MANLRLLQIKVQDSTTIKAKFSSDLDPFINTSNITITSTLASVPDSEVLKLDIFKQVVTITCQPLTPGAAYIVTFASSETAAFKSKDGSAFLLEDGKTNAPIVIGAEDPADPMRDTLIDLLKDSPYNLSPGDISRDIVNSIAKNLSRALYDIRQLKTDNYLSVTITDELKTRGAGPFDRLNEEGAYEIVRVGTRPAGFSLSADFEYEEFPTFPITLLRREVEDENLEAGSGAGTFSGLILTLNNRFVTKVTEITVLYEAGGSDTYDIESLGYQLLSNRYDQDFASTYLILDDNQVKLSDDVLGTDFVLPAAGDTVIVSYEYQDKGRIVDENSVEVTQVLEVTREVTSPILTDFSLKHGPIVTEGDQTPTSDGVEFLDPESNPPFSATHPAFLHEIPFNYGALPVAPGEYSIDYSTGRVFVYGAEENDGTGDYPPVANYFYRKYYDSRLDYTYDPTTSELVASPLRDLSGENVTVSFDFEKEMVPGVDYEPQVHTEVLDERIENRLNTTGSLRVEHTPITNVFRIYNETSGEIYKISRWSDDTVYFTSNISPNIQNLVRERVAFTDVLNEVLLINTEFDNILGTRVFEIILENNRIISASEDGIGSSFNSSASFSRADIFVTELYFDGQVQDPEDSYNRLGVGDYQIDYDNGKIYLGVSVSQGSDIGSINYKKPIIAPANSHVISVSELYHSISSVIGINKRIDYLSVDEGEVVPATFDRADERFLSGDDTLPYTVDNNTITVTDDIKDIRGIFDVYDLNNNEAPTNFADGASVSFNVITLDPDGISKQEILEIETGLELNVSFISSGIELAGIDSLIRVSDGYALEVSSFSDYNIVLNSAGTPVVGQSVEVNYRIKMNGAATPVVDYNRGDYFMDYDYLADEILVSYEYGDNCLDFRTSSALDVGDEYFVTYKIGALRDGLLKNFGSLVDIPVMKTFDTSLPRERYRDALKAALQTFTKGPTVPAIKELVSDITHIDPEVTESAFQNWNLGISRLYPGAIGYTGDLQLLSSKFDNGVLIENSDETITFPISSNLRLEEGTMEMWVTPEWNGLDNDSTLTVEVYRDGSLLDPDNIYLGSDSHHPDSNSFEVHKDDATGFPSSLITASYGFFLYFDSDTNRWKAYAKDQIAPSVDDEIGEEHTYTGTITSTGEFYDVKFLPGLGELTDKLTTKNNTIEFTWNFDEDELTSSIDGYVDGYDLIDGYSPGDGYADGYSYDGISFMSDNEHYLFDFGKTDTTNRFSLYKDGRGYLNFRVKDAGPRLTNYVVSNDISSWIAGEKHHVAIAWKLNTPDRRDEMHLFVDGSEVPNILRYGGRPEASATDRFRTVKPEILLSVIPSKTISDNDLETISGSAAVTGERDFQAEGIVPGDEIYIRETGFGYYSIVSVVGNTLVLDDTMPASLSNVRYSINPYSTVVSSEVNLASNLAVSIISGATETELPGLRAELPGYEVSTNMLGQSVLTILGDAEAGDTVAIRTLGFNHKRIRDRQYIWGNTSTSLKTQLPPPINLDEVKIYPITMPLSVIGPDNAVESLGSFTYTQTSGFCQPSNSAQGRTLSIRVTGSNVNYSVPVTVTINGTSSGGASEVVNFSASGTQNTTNKWQTISSVVVTVLPFTTSRDSLSIEIKETYSMLYSEGNTEYPLIRYSYQVQSGTYLQGDGSDVVQDQQGFFPTSILDQKLIITSPGGIAGTYNIVERINDTTIKLNQTIGTSFTEGVYQVYNISTSRSGFANGYFHFETAGNIIDTYELNQGYYELDYSSYLVIPFDPIDELGYIGSDRNGSKQANVIIDEFRILNTALTDVRTGEIPGNSDYITTDFTAIRPFKKDQNTLMLLHFDEKPFVNESDYWIAANREYLQSGNSVNENFERSVVLTDKPVIINNTGLLTTNSEGTIEFWVSPRYDTYNDPNFRFYFDANSAVVEEITSISSATVKVSGRISSVISVTLVNDDKDYFSGGSIASDGQTIRLNKSLPYQQTPVKVSYIPSGLVGNRISIYKDQEGFLVFNVKGKKSNSQEIYDFQVKQAIFWPRDTWHRVRATFKFNRPNNDDEIRLFVDGEEKGTILFGQGLLFGDGAVFGQAAWNDATLIDDINFTDPLNEFYLGSDYLKVNNAQARMDNLRISNTSRNPYFVASQPIDVNWQGNTDMAMPVVEDVYTTYLLDFNTLIEKTEDFTLLRDEVYGIFNFTLDIIDSFDIVLDNAKVQQILETLISALKPATSKATINYHR